MDISNRKPIALVASSRDESSPAWSPDGRQIAFVSNPDGDVIIVMNADGSNEPKRVTGYSQDSYPAWSPDGKQIAFVSQRDGNAEIYVMNVDDPRKQINLTNNPAWDADLSWSPDSKQIAFTSNRDGADGFQIYVMNADGSGQTRLPNNRPIGTWNSFPNWSHDGARIAFPSRDISDGLFQIYVMSAYGDGDPVRLTDVGDNETVRWSPDDKLMAFTTTRDGNSEVYLMKADGSEQINLTESPANEGSAAWQP